MISKNSVVAILLVTVWYGAAVPDPSYDTQNYAITGVHTNIGEKRQGDAVGPRPVRRNIFEMQNDIPAWSLYIQALQKMQSTSEEDYLSWFQIAGKDMNSQIYHCLMRTGIHGRPYIPWDFVEQAPNAPLTGYCFHNSVLFLTWHRPYLALFEQVLASHCQDIAGTYPPNQLPIYQAAANNFRIPFWDWASNNQIPPVVNALNVTITTSSGVRNVSNPLFQYTFQTFPENQAWFPSNSNDGDGVLASYSQTVRGVSVPGGPGNPALPNSWMNNYPFMSQTVGLSSWLAVNSQIFLLIHCLEPTYIEQWNALVKSTLFDNFATTATPGPSIEEPHNEVHSDVGGWGHMAFLSYSAFDPILYILPLFYYLYGLICLLVCSITPTSIDSSQFGKP
jgi:tyrosinase